MIDLEAYAVMGEKVREYFPHASARKYQASLANNVYDALSAGYRDLVVEAPTGLGKAGGGSGCPAYSAGVDVSLADLQPAVLTSIYLALAPSPQPRIDLGDLRRRHGLCGRRGSQDTVAHEDRISGEPRQQGAEVPADLREENGLHPRDGFEDRSEEVQRRLQGCQEGWKMPILAGASTSGSSTDNG